MDSDFLTWWFEKHWFWSTLLTPGVCFAWACWKGLVARAIVAFIFMGGIFGASKS